MTLLSRRKLRTTARRITPATLAANIAVILTLCAAPAIAQPPSYPPANYPPQGYSSGDAQPQGNRWGNQKAGTLPLPPGYRPRAVPASKQPAPTPTPGSNGTVMYFQKPADALTVAGDTSSPAGEVAQLNAPNRVPATGVPDAPASRIPPPPPPPASRYLPAERMAPPPAMAIPPVLAASAQPDMQPKPADQPNETYTAKKQAQQQIPPVPDQYIQLPSRGSVFLTYDNLQLEEAIMERLREDLKKEGKYTPDQERYLVFPPVPLISPPGVPYVAKTASYPPHQAMLEPNYLVHRRLHFEERNAERTGWDLGPMQVLVSSAYFWRDALLWPQSLASGCVYGFWDTSAGKCLPGSPNPYYLYPPGLTLTGSVVEGAVITGGAFLFP